MPARLSLWLLPTEAAAVNLKLEQILHGQIAPLFLGESLPKFVPHVTLAVGIDSSFFEPNKPQAWLESLDLNVVRGGDVKIIFTEVKAGTTFTKKCYLQVRKTSSLEGLEKQLQRTIFKSSEEEARKLFEEWDPHLSLLYWSGEVSDEQLAAIKTVVDEAGVDLSAGHTAWAGGRIQLVDTSKSVDQWKVLAERLIE